MRIALLPFVLVLACGDSATATNPVDSGSDVLVTLDAPSSQDASTIDAPATDATPPLAPLTIFTIVFENHDYAEVIGSPNAPYFNALAKEYGLATSYSDSGTHPSLPNYLVLASGDTQYPGVVDLNPTTFPFPKKAANLGTQLEAAKIPWRSYQESMGTACNLAPTGNYAPKHDPFLYFDDMQKGANGLCAAHNVDYTQFPADLAAGTYRYMFITPNLISDGHDPSNDPVAGIKASDAWAKTNVEPILASAAFQANGILLITWDEAEGRNNDSKSQVPMIVVTPKLKGKGFKTTTKYDHKSYLATVEDLLGLPRLPTVTATPSMLEFFK
ncbi:N/A [soil metagenome]